MLEQKIYDYSSFDAVYKEDDAVWATVQLFAGKSGCSLKGSSIISTAIISLLASDLGIYLT